MKKIKYILLIIGFSLAFFACEDFLEENPTGDLTRDAELSSNESGLAVTNGAYEALDNWTDGTSEWGGNLMGSLEYWTGFAHSSYMGSRLWKFEADDQDGGEDYMNNQWVNWYRGVRDANFAIEKIPEIDGLNPEEKSQYLGEVRTLRAFYYFCLVRYYGDVVRITEPLEDVDNAEQPRRSLVGIYDDIIVPDLEFAVNESALPEKQTDGRVTKDAARAILADVYLTMAGYPYQEAKDDTTQNWCTEGLWSDQEYPVDNQSAIDLLQKAQTQLEALYGNYPMTELTHINEPGHMNNGEGAIFQIQYKAGVSDLGIREEIIPLNSHTTVYTVETGTIVPAEIYHESYPDGDKRTDDRVYFYYSDNKAKKYDPNQAPVNFTIPHLYKYYDETAAKETGNSGLNFNLYRYADVLLMLTEVNWALNQLGVGVSGDDILKGINQVRERAGLSTYNSVSDLTLKDIMAERAYELIFENKMIWDQRRTRKVLVNGEGEFSDLADFMGHKPDRFNYEFSAKHLLAPIAAQEIDRNRNVKQNYGWTPTQ